MTKNMLYNGALELISWKSPFNDGSKCMRDKKTGLEVLHLNSIQSLIQALGYLKYKYPYMTILYRGQTELYDTGVDGDGQYFFQPSALRGIKRVQALNAAKRKLQEKVAVLRKMIPQFADEKKISDAVLEGLLQQYGISTTWFDVVVNIWIALWFACYKADNSVYVGKGSNRRCLLHMVRRKVYKEKIKDRFAYVFVLGADSQKAEIIDLRCKLPSNFIRPHAQHGLLIRTSGAKTINMIGLVKGIIRIRLEDALEWLGDGKILSPEIIVPPPNYDSGFGMLLNSEQEYVAEDVIRFPIYC